MILILRSTNHIYLSTLAQTHSKIIVFKCRKKRENFDCGAEDPDASSDRDSEESSVPENLSERADDSEEDSVCSSEAAPASGQLHSFILYSCFIVI